MKSLIVIFVFISFCFAADDTAYVTTTTDSVKWKKATLEISRDPKTLDITLVLDHLAFQAQSTKQLSEINDDMGEIRAGKILALSAGKYPTDADATGAFMSAAGETFPEGTFNIGGVNNGELQFGLSSADGKAYAGAGAVVLDKDGIKLELTETT